MQFKEWLFSEIIQDSSYLDAAKSILPQLQNYNGAGRGLFAKLVYGALTSRQGKTGNDQAYQVIQQFEPKYREALARLQQYFDGVGYEVKTSGGWFQVDTPFEQNRQYRMMGDKRETAKFYWSLTIDPQNLAKFLNALPNLGRTLWQISQQHNDYIRFKIPPHLKVMTRHADSLVVYMANPRNRSVVKQAVDGWFRQNGIQTEQRSGGRGDVGYDWKTPGKDQEAMVVTDKGGGSHSELVAHAIADQIHQNAAQFAQVSPQQMAQWMKSWAERLSTMSPRGMHQQIWGNMPQRTDPYSQQGSVPV